MYFCFLCGVFLSGPPPTATAAHVRTHNLQSAIQDPSSITRNSQSEITIHTLAGSVRTCIRHPQPAIRKCCVVSCWVLCCVVLCCVVLCCVVLCCVVVWSVVQCCGLFCCVVLCCVVSCCVVLRSVVLCCVCVAWRGVVGWVFRTIAPQPGQWDFTQTMASSSAPSPSWTMLLLASTPTKIYSRLSRAVLATSVGGISGRWLMARAGHICATSPITPLP